MRCSETSRAIVCPGSLVAPRRLLPSSNSKKATGFGTLAHHWKETGETNPAWASSTDVDLLERKVLMSGIEREMIWSGGIHELTFALNLVTLELHEYGGPRAWADWWKKLHGPEWLTGTSDYETEEEINDLKTGSWPVSAHDNAQLKSYALRHWRLAGMQMDYKRKVSIIQWSKYPINALPTYVHSTVSGLDLMLHLESLQWAFLHPSEYNITDEGCKFCHAKADYKDFTCVEAL